MCFRNKFLLFMGIVCICTAAENPPLRRREVQVRSSRSSHNVPVAEMMSQINDRVSALATLDQAQRNKLEAIENKLNQLDSSTHARLESIHLQQQETSKQLENLEHMQHNVQTNVMEIRNQLDIMRFSVDQTKDTKPTSHVRTRQAVLDSNDTEIMSSKFDALATFLISIQSSVRNIEKSLTDYGSSLTKLTQLTRGTHKRLSNFPSRHLYNSAAPAQPQFPQVYSSYGPPPMPQFTLEPNSCAQALPPVTGITKIQVDAQSEPFYSLCESADQGGWTVIQNRFDGSINFNRDWEEYKRGFGNLAGEFFIGLEKLHAMTSSHLHELLIVLVDFKNETRIAKYGAFSIGGEKEFFALQILGDYSGTAGDSLSYQAGNKFSTFDNDNDGWVEGNCAQAHTGAWWYGACEMSNLNGQYLEGDVDSSQQYQGIYWNEFHGPLYSLKSVQMKIRPIEPRDNL